MNSIGIITLYDDNNIGNKLQNYAVQAFFSSLGYRCETIQHYEMVHKPLTLQTIKLGLIRLIGFPRNSSRKLRLGKIRRKVFKKFSEQYIQLGPVVSYEHLPAGLCDQYDYFVTGSDQVWHNWTHSKAEIDYFMLQFARENQRLTMSPSFGFKTVDEHFRGDYIRGLQGIPVITCREQDGAEIVKELTGKHAYVLLDPTMLIDTEKWIDIEKKSEFPSPERFILVYALGEMPEEVRAWINETAAARGMGVIDILDPSNEELYMTTPDEFIYFIHHAELVVTDSFHASVFSILLKRPFVVFDRTTASMGDMSSRLQTLLETFSLHDRRYGVCKDAFQVDYSSVDEVLRRERERAAVIYRDTILYLNNLSIKAT